MHTIWSRGSYASSTASYVVGIVAVVVALIGYGQLYFNGAWGLTAASDNIHPKVTLRTTRRSGSVDGKPKENLRIKFDLDADMTPLFNWNTKQVFVYLTAEYPGSRDDIVNIVTLWDKIIAQKSAAHIQLTGQNAKYNVWDTARTFDGKEANLTLRWQVQPQVGLIANGDIPLDTFVIPVPDS